MRCLNFYRVVFHAIKLITDMECWMGTWAAHVHHFSSNWRELRTLLATLQRVSNKDSIQGCTFFYFTDNLVTYYIVQRGSSSSVELHRLIRRIKNLEILLHCHLEVIHVPGSLMIHQGTDGLSRGLWVSSERLRLPSSLEAERVLCSVPMSEAFAAWCLAAAGLDPTTPFTIQSEWSSWSFADIAHRLTVWSLQPETARQTLFAYLSAWVEVPTTTAAIFVIPRILQRDWGFISKHISCVGEFHPLDLPHLLPDYSEIPFVVLCTYSHERRLPAHRLEFPTSPSDEPAWHREQVEELRRLFEAF